MTQKQALSLLQLIADLYSVINTPNPESEGSEGEDG